jgi:membrane fusion protein, multidrug efflux system
LPERGRINFADRMVDPATGTLRVRAAFHNPGWVLRPGQFARVRIRRRELPGALLVPQRTVLQIQDTYAVYVVGADGKAAFRTIQPGPQIGSWWVVNEGLKPGERVVVAGLEKLSNGMAVRPSDVPLDSLPPPPSPGGPAADSLSAPPTSAEAPAGPAPAAPEPPAAPAPSR